MKSSLSAMGSVRGCGARVMHEMVMMIGFLSGTPPLRNGVVNWRRGLLELRPVAIGSDISRVLTVMRVRLVFVRTEIFIVEAF